MAKQTQDAGAGAVAVQISGDGNSVHIIRAGEALALSLLHARKAKPTTTLEVLRTDLRATTLVGRETQCQDLAAWRASPQPIAVHCITGGAGAGKTRLAIEACEAAAAEGWIAGFAPSDELARFHQEQNLVHWQLPQHALIVVDYAATSLAVLKAWFSLLAPVRHHPVGHKLRILLLERQADPESGWWADLNRRDSNDHAGPADLLGQQALFPLPVLDRPADRHALLADAMRLAAPLLDPPVAAPAPPLLGSDPWFDARLADRRIDNQPLYLMMAGVHAARHGAPAALALDHVELANKMAEIETARLGKLARARGFPDDGKLLKHLAACVTLQNGCPPAALPALIREEMAALSLNAPFDAEGVAGHLCDYLPVIGDLVEPIRPDLIAEALLIRVIQGDRFRPEDIPREIVRRAYHRAPAGTVDTLIRCAQDFANGRADHASVRWLWAIVETSDDLAELARISDFLPEDTLSLREFAGDVAVRIVAVLRAAVSRDPEAVTTALAGSLNNLANRLSDLGRREDALAAAEEAVTLSRTLAAAQPDAFTPDLATSLNTLANCLSALGQREDALAAAEEAVTLRRALAAARPDAFTPDLAMSLNNLAAFLSALGRREDALAAAEAAVTLRRDLAAARPDVFTPDLAMSLNNLAAFLSALGRREDALAAAEEAVTLRRTLAAARPDAFTPALAGALNTLANRLSDLGRREDALAAAEEAVTLYRALAAARPDAFTPDLAMSLNTLAIRLSDLGWREDALAAAEEAVTLSRALAAARPDAFIPDLATSLSVLGDMLEAVGKISDAIPNDEEAVRLLTPYFLLNPAAFAGTIATYARDYIRRCELARREPDPTLLEPIVDRPENGAKPER
ncbi:tetratricopeptide repeat protein [Acidibrevibacterium fodinaquatile]|uniref:tetratricopeptide repeat protein n=1 Tax=Acidibrevibacterium fodinaquatile TaxID=1969806 RepID=UPI000E0DB3FE|nr:tetratricopeptide repeat protein [Acidibrevibacterium fodinaquatile]